MSRGTNMTTSTAKVASRAAAKRRLVVYLGVTFALTWVLDIGAGLALGSFGHGEGATPLIVAPIAISMFFPLVGALVANRASKPADRIDLCFRPFVRENVRYYVAAWLIPAILSALGCILFFAVNPQLFDPTFAGYLRTLEAAGGPAASSMPSADELASAMPAMVAVTFVAAITVAPFLNAIPAFGEEAGWRGMLFPTLRELMSTRAAAIVSGIIWGVWHAPVIAMGHNYGMGYSGFPWAGIVVMTVACTAFGLTLCYLRLHTQSVWPCALAHGALNAVANAGVVFCAAGQTLAGPSPLGYVAGIPMLVLGGYCFAKMPRE